MYGRANPKPLPPSYDSDDLRRMREAERLLLTERMRTDKSGARARGGARAI